MIRPVLKTGSRAIGSWVRIPLSLPSFTSSEIDELVPVLKTRQATDKAVPLITVNENPKAMCEWYEHFMVEAKRGEEFLVWSAGKDWYKKR